MNCCRCALNNALHAAVAHIPDVALESQFRSFGESVLAEEHALHFAPNNKLDSHITTFSCRPFHLQNQ